MLRDPAVLGACERLAKHFVERFAERITAAEILANTGPALKERRTVPIGVVCRKARPQRACALTESCRGCGHATGIAAIQSWRLGTNPGGSEFRES